MTRDRSEIERVKLALSDPWDVCRRLGLAEGARRQRHGLVIHCPAPAHCDDDPSCSVRNLGDGIAVKCHACGFRGDVLHLIAAALGLDIRRGTGFAEVLRRAAELGRVEANVVKMAPQPARRPEAPPLPNDRFAAVVGPILFCGEIGGVTPCDVARYLAGRGVLDAARSDGWAALPPPRAQPAWTRVLYDAASPSEGYVPPFTPDELRRAGLLSGLGFAHPAARLCIPWRDPGGHLVNLQRRRIDGGEPRYVAPKGRSFEWPYGVERLQSAPPDAPIAIVEGALDVLALRTILAARHEGAVVLGVPGLAAWRASWGALARGRVVAVAVDADDAGERYVMQIAHDCVLAGALRPERWTPPAKDWAAVTGKEAA